MERQMHSVAETGAHHPGASRLRQGCVKISQGISFVAAAAQSQLQTHLDPRVGGILQALDRLALLADELADHGARDLQHLLQSPGVLGQG